jgi:hypothetical protein
LSYTVNTQITAWVVHLAKKSGKPKLSYPGIRSYLSWEKIYIYIYKSTNNKTALDYEQLVGGCGGTLFSISPK